MDIKEILLSKDIGIDTKGIVIPILSQEEKECIKFYLELIGDIEEIEQLFRVFCVNLKNILYFYRLNNNDVITRNLFFDFQDNDNIIMNAFIISYISSGKTLKEAIENFAKQKIGEDTKQYNCFKIECLNKLYDDFFGYRLLLRMRDFAQHGHLPVSVDSNNKYFFDLEQILLTPHFNFNNRLKEEIEKIKKEVYEYYEDHPRIAFTISIAEFNFCIIKTYVEFLNTIEELFYDSLNKVNLLLQNRPDIIYKSQDSLDGLVFFDDYDDMFHCFDPKEDACEVFEFIKSKALKMLQQEENELNILKQSYVYK